MALRQIEDYTKGEQACQSEEHNPPSHVVLNPGKYEWTCPSCGKRQVFEVPLII